MKTEYLNRPLYCMLCMLFSFVCQAQEADSLAMDQLTDAVAELQNGDLLRNGTLGFSLRNAKTGKNLLALNPGKTLPSASTLKIVTTATALSVFDPQYRFKTYLEYSGSIQNDTLKGNIFIRGTGDPALGSSRFPGNADVNQLVSLWTEQITAAGIRFVQGDIVADASFFDRKGIADSWIWGDIGNYYGAGIYGLNINENMYQVNFKSGKAVGDSTSVLGFEPSMKGYQVRNLVSTGPEGSGDKVTIYAAPDSKLITLSGTVPRGSASFPVKGAIPNPPLYLAEALADRLITKAVLTSGFPKAVFVSADLNRVILGEVASPVLADIARQTNWWSVNVFADGLLKAVGKRLMNQSDFDESVAVMQRFWSEKEVNTAGFRPKDGSGLSPSGGVTAQSLSDILSKVANSVNFKDVYDSMPVLGVSGTVRNLGKNTRAAGNLRVKSGSISGTRAYTGYATTKSGALLSFAILANQYEPDSASQVSKELVKLMTLIGGL